jgi:hypothetical protein
MQAAYGRAVAFFLHCFVYDQEYSGELDLGPACMLHVYVLETFGWLEQHFCILSVICISFSRPSQGSKLEFRTQYQ